MAKDEKRETVFEPSAYLSNLVPRGARLLDYFGVWAVEEDSFRKVVEANNGRDLLEHIRAYSDDRVGGEEARAGDGDGDSGRGFEVTDGGVAVIAIDGEMMKHESSFGGASTVGIRKALRAAVAAEDVHSILLHVDSPGGTVDGTSDLAAEIRSAVAKKPVEAFIDGLGASAAYWVAAQAERVYANDTAQVGSIGIFTVLQDTSERAARLGVKVHVVRSSAMKAVGVPGTEVTDEHLVDAQRIVDGYNDLFVEAVARGRGITRAKAAGLADGRIHLAAEAQKLGLIDGVKSLDDVLAGLAGRGGVRSGARASAAGPEFESGHEPKGKGESVMANEDGKDTGSAAVVAGPATLEELKASCVGADASFLVNQLEAKATVEQARGAWMAAQNERMSALEGERDSAQAEAATAKEETASAKAAGAELVGVDAIGDGGGDATKAEGDGDPIAAFNEAVTSRMEAKGCPKHVAHKWACREHPELREAMVAAFNAGYSARKATIAAKAQAAQAQAARV